MFGVGIIYAGGVVGLELVLHWPAEKLLVQGVLLFIPFDLAKSVFAAVLTTSAAPKKALGNEKDRGRPYARWWPAGAPPR
jgi:biotin transporter BioY